MSEAVAKLVADPIRVAVLAPDPARRSFLVRLVSEMGHVAVASADEASVILTEGVAIGGDLPVVALGTDGDYLAHLSHAATPEQIDAALRAVLVGLSVSPADEPGSKFAALGEEDEHILLTPREIEVLHAVSDGFTNKEIARRLGISQHTVKFHLESLMRKLETSSRAEAVAKSMRLDLLKPYRL